MHTNTDSRKSFKVKGVSIPLILFITFLGLGYYLGSGDTFSSESTKEHVSGSTFFIDSGQFSFPVFLYPF